MAADLIVFDPSKLRDVAQFGDAMRYAEGVDYLFVNGVLVIDDWGDDRSAAREITQEGSLAGCLGFWPEPNTGRPASAARCMVWLVARPVVQPTMPARAVSTYPPVW